MLKTEPAMVIGVVMSLVVLAIAFGAPITQGQQVAIEETLEQVVPFIFAILGGSFLTRQSVIAPATAERKFTLKPGVEAPEVWGDEVR